MFRDSFGNTLHSLLAEDFGHALFSRAQPYDLGLMDQTGATCVVVEIVERNLRLLSQVPFILPAPQVELSQTVEPGNHTASATAVESPSTPHYLTLTGWIDPCDEDSPLYLRAGSLTYELSPVGETDTENYPFTAYLPLETDLSEAEILYKEQDLWYAVPLEIQ